MVELESNQKCNDIALVIRAQKRDQQAFTLLYECYHNKISRFVSYKVKDNNICCELVQETFLKAWRALPELRTPACFIPWLYRIARNTISDYQKRQPLIPPCSLDTCKEEGDALSMMGPEEGVEQRELIHLAFTQLSPKYRACLILYVIEGLPQREIAKRLNINETCIGSTIRRGKEEWRKIYHQLLQERTNERRGR